MNKDIPSLYSEEIWSEWVAIEDKNYISKEKAGSNRKLYLKKGYDHIDHRVWFPERKGEVKAVVSSLTKLQQHKFLPFLKTKIKIPRLKKIPIREVDAGEKNQKVYKTIKERPICFASHFDALIYGYCAFSLNKIYQTYVNQLGFGECILAYRTDLQSKCNIQFAKEVFDDIKSRGRCVALTFDIKGYFDHIDHALLKEKWKKVLGEKELPADQYLLYRQLTKYSYINKSSLLKHFAIKLNKRRKQGNYWQNILDFVPGEKAGPRFRDKLGWLHDSNFIVTNSRVEVLNDGRKRHYGVPQGSAISALLSNIYLIDFDQFLFDISQQHGFLYRRYCDDILVVCPPEIATKIEQIVTRKITEYKVHINTKKTEQIAFLPNSIGKIRAFDGKRVEDDNRELTSENEQQFYKNLQYLGFEFNGQNVYIRPSSLSRYFRKMKARISKTIGMAYSDSAKADKIFKKQLYSRYSHLGKRNFLSYALNASREYYFNSKGDRKEGLNSPQIRKQIARHIDAMCRELEKESTNRARNKSRNRKIVALKR